MCEWVIVIHIKKRIGQVLGFNMRMLGNQLLCSFTFRNTREDAKLERQAQARKSRQEERWIYLSCYCFLIVIQTSQIQMSFIGMSIHTFTLPEQVSKYNKKRWKRGTYSLQDIKLPDKEVFKTQDSTTSIKGNMYSEVYYYSLPR